MKIDYAVMSSDNSHYLDYWPVISYIWEKKIGITPILLYFGDDYLHSTIGGIVNMGQCKKPIGITTCWSRYWWACQQEDKVSIITDIDMIPLSKDHFTIDLEKYPQSSYIHLNDCISTYSRLPSCYHVASGHTFKDVLQIDSDFEKSLDILLSMNYNNKECYIDENNKHWCYDEFWATEKILLSERKDIYLLKRDMSKDRIDRTNWQWDKNMQYIDSHLLRPYKDYLFEIQEIIKRYHYD